MEVNASQIRIALSDGKTSGILNPGHGAGRSIILLLIIPWLMAI
ncbi:MAG TPA: hypothetical protein VJ951_10185 [Bacteroidales bacterium]|nr:hypothetical protein [Bacteroidales bacterium]